jgi:hypothetical protein
VLVRSRPFIDDSEVAMVEQVASWPYSKQKNVISKLTRSPDDYIEDRVQFKINQYVKKASRYRCAYRILASTAAIGSATVPVLINIPGIDSVYPTILGLGIAIIVALEGVWHPAEHWRNYDLISAVLREEEMRFSTRAPPYDEKDGKDNNFAKFVDRVEDAIAKERGQTIVMRTAQPSAIGNGPPRAPEGRTDAKAPAALPKEPLP